VSDAPIATGTTNTTPNSLQLGTTDRLWKPWAVSDSFFPFMAEWESGILNGKNYANQKVTNGMILYVYLDSRKLPTVGCGHLVVAEDHLKIGETITYEQAVNFLKQDLKIAEARVNILIKVPLYQHEYDALVDIAVNAGTGNGLTGIAREVNKGKYSTIPAFIQTYRTGGGNENRRRSESQLFERGTYDASH
jgi:lysozyme